MLSTPSQQKPSTEAQRGYLRADRCRRTTRKTGRGDVDERNRDNEISTEKQAVQPEERVQDHLEDDIGKRNLRNRQLEEIMRIRIISTEYTLPTKSIQGNVVALMQKIIFIKHDTLVFVIIRMLVQNEFALKNF